MVTAAEAKEWAREHLRGNCSSLYTPFSGRDGDEIDYAALRALVRHCAGFKFGASVLGLPVGDYPHSRPPQTAFPDELKAPVLDAYRAAGFLSADG